MDVTEAPVYDSVMWVVYDDAGNRRGAFDSRKDAELFAARLEEVSA